MLDINADAVGYGGTAALSWKITDTLGLGLVYRSEVREELENDDTNIRGLPGKYSCWENLTLPQSASIGLNYSGVEKWNFGAIATWTGWSSYDNLTLHFDQPLLGRISEAGSDKCWNDVWRFGVGVEYQLSDHSFVEVGYVFDQDPIDRAHADYLLPAGDRDIISAGLRTMITDNWELGIAFAKILVHDTTIQGRPAEGVFDTKFKNGDSNVYSIQLSRAF
jgi:long-chain fatty acid transport protein